MMDNLKKLWFFASSLLLGVLYFLLSRKTSELEQASAQLATDKTDAQVKQTTAAAAASGATYEENKQAYDELRRANADLLNRIGGADGAGPDAKH